jgi:alpha-ketoglutarate-dependent taurine dioxygenase
MLKQLTVDVSASPDLIAKMVVDNWQDSKVIHVVRPFQGSPDDLRKFYDSVLEHAGTPVDIGEDATAGDRGHQRTGQRWMEIRYDPAIEDAYRHSANAQPLHTDGSYIPAFPDAALIYCQSSASNGGATVFLDSSDLLSILRSDDPDLLEALRGTVVPHARSGDRRVSRIVEGEGDNVRLHWNYYCVDQEADAAAKALRQRFYNFLQTNEKIQKKLVAVMLKPGDCVFWKDYETLHGRNSFDPKVKSERFLWKSAVHIHAHDKAA